MTQYKVSKEEKQQDKEERELLEAFEKVAGTVSGQKVFRHLMELCGFKAKTMTMDKEHRIMRPESEYNATRRTVYCEVREFIPYRLLNTIEAERKNNARRHHSDSAERKRSNERTKRRSNTDQRTGHGLDDGSDDADN